MRDIRSKTYLGDAVYAEYDGYRIILTTEDGISVTNTIYMEPGTLKALDAYVSRLQEEEEDEYN
jgi:hypothetical protein